MTIQRPKHVTQNQFPVQDGCLLIGGIKLTRLAQQVGRTPFYAYDRQGITERIALVRQQIPSDIKIHYAVKANPMPAVVQHLAGLVDGFDVASGGELKTVLDTPMRRDCISFAGPAKNDAELSCTIAAGCVINMESEAEMERIARIGDTLGLRPRVSVRVNPDFELKSAGMKMGGGPKQFGVDAELVPDMLARLAKLDLDFEGFHIFSGSQNLKASALQETHQQTLDLAARLAAKSPTPIRLLNIGGGFGVPYFPGEAPLDLAAVGENLHRLLPNARRHLPRAQIVLELGRYLVAEAGIYVCRVLERKQSRGKTFLVTDGGMHHHLAASGNFGQVIRKNYPVLIGNRMGVGERESASVVGPLCTPLDLLADDLEMSKAAPGDLVVVLQSGAYGLTASPTAFLSHPAPLEVVV